MLADPFGRRGALTLIVLPSTLIGGALIAYGSRYIRGDISRCVEELLEEKEEADRVRQGGGRHARPCRSATSTSPTARCRCSSTSTSTWPTGETVALLGTNGAGKSTLLRVISGLGVASRGVVRLHGRTITYADPELRAKVGVVQLMGGNAIFSSLSVEENLRMAGFLYDDAELHARVEARAGPLPRARRATGDRGPATCPAGSSRCWRWRWRCCTSPTC